MNAPTPPHMFDSPQPDATGKPAPLPRVSRRALAHIPGRRGLPLLGILPDAVIDPYRFAKTMYERYGPIHCFRALGSWNVVLIGPDAHELVLVDREGVFSACEGWKPIFGRHFEGGLLLRDGLDHRRHRKIIGGAFKQAQLQGYLEIFNQVIARHVTGWAERRIDLYKSAQRLTFDIGFECLLGQKTDTSARRDLKAFRTLMRATTTVIPWALPGNSEWRCDRSKVHVTRKLREILDTPASSDRQDLAAVLQRICASEESELTKADALAHLNFVVAASFDALSSTLTSTLYHLAREPEWQQRLRQELLAHIPVPEDANVEALRDCVSTEWVIREAVRLKSAAPVLWRRTERDVSFKGRHIPRGTFVGVNPMIGHLLPEVWAEPERFDPMRFSPDEEAKRSRHAFVPFGGGAHACLGMNFAMMELKLALRYLLGRGWVDVQDDGRGWYHWPNVRPRGTVLLNVSPSPISRASRQR